MLLWSVRSHSGPWGGYSVKPICGQTESNVRNYLAPRKTLRLCFTRSDLPARTSCPAGWWGCSAAAPGGCCLGGRPPGRQQERHQRWHREGADGHGRPAYSCHGGGRRREILPKQTNSHKRKKWREKWSKVMFFNQLSLLSYMMEFCLAMYNVMIS